MKTLQLFIDWSEVWALLIPMTVILINRNNEKYLRPIIFYVFAAFFINLAADIIAALNHFKTPFKFPEYLQTNTFLYNTHSILRFACFSSFFIGIRPQSFLLLKRALLILGLAFAVVYFCFENFNNPNHISADFLAIEAFFMLIYCMLYFLNKLKDENYKPMQAPDFWVALGLSVYVVINFFVFLFYIPMVKQNAELANKMWNVHNIAFITFCILLSKAFKISRNAYGA